MSEVALPRNLAPFTADEVVAATGGRWLEAPTAALRGVSTDTRTCQAGNVFIALSGERFDAHLFVDQALAAGAEALVVERPVSAPPGIGVLQVPSTRVALGALAAFHRRRWTGRLLAIGGSAGKTTTRRTVAAVLAAHRPDEVHTTAGNFNNDIGVPLTLLGLTGAHRFAVVEIGTNQRGEVAALAAITAPSLALLTLIGAEHTEGLGSLDEVAREEGDLYAALPKDGLAIGNADDVRVLEQLTRTEAPRITYGTSPTATMRLLERQGRGEAGSQLELLRADGSRLIVPTPLVGAPGAYATLAAVTACEAMLGGPIDPAALQAGLQAVAAAGDGRLTLRHTPDGVVWIDDCYNANPPSMLAGIETAIEVAALRHARLVLVLGEMRELGALGPEEHRRISERLRSVDYAELIAVTGLGRDYLTFAKGRFAETALDAVPLLREALRAGDVVLLKGSRGVRLERILHTLYPNPTKEHA